MVSRLKCMAPSRRTWGLAPGFQKASVELPLSVHSVIHQLASLILRDPTYNYINYINQARDKGFGS